MTPKSWELLQTDGTAMFGESDVEFRECSDQLGSSGGTVDGLCETNRVFGFPLLCSVLGIPGYRYSMNIHACLKSLSMSFYTSL